MNEKLIEEARNLQPAWHRGMYGSRDDMYANVKPLISRLADALEAAESQGEPSDAQVRAALREWHRDIIAGGWTEDHEARMRAALRAAAGAGAR